MRAGGDGGVGGGVVKVTACLHMSCSLEPTRRSHKAQRPESCSSLSDPSPVGLVPSIIHAVGRVSRRAQLGRSESSVYIITRAASLSVLVLTISVDKLSGAAG